MLCRLEWTVEQNVRKYELWRGFPVIAVAELIVSGLYRRRMAVNRYGNLSDSGVGQGQQSDERTP